MAHSLGASKRCTDHNSLGLLILADVSCVGEITARLAQPAMARFDRQSKTPDLRNFLSCCDAAFSCCILRRFRREQPLCSPPPVGGSIEFKPEVRFVQGQPKRFWQVCGANWASGSPGKQWSKRRKQVVHTPTSTQSRPLPPVLPCCLCWVRRPVHETLDGHGFLEWQATASNRS